MCAPKSRLMKKYIALLSLFALFASAPADAQTPDDTLFGRKADLYGPKARAFTFTGFVGWYWHGQDQDLIDASDRFNEAWTSGIRAGWAFTRNFELEGSVGFCPTKTSVATQNAYYWTLDFVAQTPGTSVIFPYLTAGLGGLLLSPDGARDTSHFALDYGVGVKWFIFKNLALRPEIRGLSSFEPAHTAALFTLNLTYYAQTRAGSASAVTAAPVVTLPAPAPTPAPAESAPKDKLENFSGVITGIHFESNSSQISQDSYPLLDNAADFFVRHPELRFRIEGHTDDQGTFAHNQRLSEERAGAVKHYLVNKGVPESHVGAEGYGESRPIAENGSPEGRARNRRIEFKVLNPEIFKE
jgi:outer membrane protein OmpA-like peptidoglycan-associated protein